MHPDHELDELSSRLNALGGAVDAGALPDAPESFLRAVRHRRIIRRIRILTSTAAAMVLLVAVVWLAWPRAAAPAPGAPRIEMALGAARPPASRPTLGALRSGEETASDSGPESATARGEGSPATPLLRLRDAHDPRFGALLAAM